MANPGPALPASFWEKYLDGMQAAVDAGEGSQLPRVMTALSRPTRIVRGKEVDPAWTVDAELFEFPEEGVLQQAQQAAASKITRDMPLDEFLEVCPVPGHATPCSLQQDSLQACADHAAVAVHPGSD